MDSENSATPLTLPVPVSFAPVRAGRWESLGERTSGATIWRVEGGAETFYVKAAPPRGADDPRFAPAAEAERLRWLGARGVPVPHVVEVASAPDGEWNWLVTTALPGVPASEDSWTPDQQVRIVEALAELTRAVHAFPPAECPFDRSLDVLLGVARAAARDGVVDLDDLEDEYAGWSAQQLLDKLEGLPRPVEDIVVCHGDLSLDNVLIDPATLAVSGVIDAGRLGRADRWLDLSVVLAGVGDCVSWGAPEHRERFLERYGLDRVDRDKLVYFELIDEFM